jgi:hypothetical protein
MGIPSIDSCSQMVVKMVVKPGLSPRKVFGDEGARTPDPLLAKQVLYQLSYIPK